MNNRQKMQKFFVAALFVIAGGAAGYLYYRFVGCASGHCPITSNPINSTLYGAMLGLFISFSFLPGKRGGAKGKGE